MAHGVQLWGELKISGNYQTGTWTYTRKQNGSDPVYNMNSKNFNVNADGALSPW